MKVLKVDFSVEGFKELNKKLKQFKKDVKTSNKEIVNDLLETAEKEIQNGYSTSPYEGYNEDFTIGKDDKKAFVKGDQVVYREFGTGTQGAEDGHPWKADFRLNPYNSGKTIRTAKENINPETGISPRRIILDFL